ncbi:MAG: ABC transporter ATP-binding protein [Treponema sp.]|nr:ABC transporter ATP-binding protein [Treponema sp.]
MSNSKSLLSIKNLSIETDQLRLIKNFNLELKAGECKGISAPTGTGKTTLFNYIAGLLPQKEYTITGELVKAPDLKIAYVFQEPRLIPGLSALKNVMLPLENILEPERAISASRIWLERFKLSNKANALPNNLSGGEQQRVNLARAFAYLGATTGSEGLLLLDEPFASQDEENAQNIQSLIKEMLFMQKKSALIISHDKPMLQQICSEVYGV